MDKFTFSLLDCMLYSKHNSFLGGKQDNDTLGGFLRTAVKMGNWIYSADDFNLITGAKAVLDHPEASGTNPRQEEIGYEQVQGLELPRVIA